MEHYTSTITRTIMDGSLHILHYMLPSDVGNEGSQGVCRVCSLQHGGQESPQHQETGEETWVQTEPSRHTGDTETTQ